MRRRVIAAWGAAILVPATSQAILPAGATPAARAPAAATFAPQTPAQTPPPTSAPAPAPAEATPATADPATARHVDCRTGDDAGDGSTNAPWRTPQSLATRALQPDTHVLLRRGCAWDGPVRLVGERIVLGAYGEGAAPVLSAADADRLTPVLTVDSPGGAVRDLVIADGAGAGVQLVAPGASVSRTEVTGTAFGVQFAAPDGVADAVYVHDLHMDTNTPGGDDDAGAVAFDVRAPRATVRGSHAERCRAPSYDYGYDHSYCLVFTAPD